MKRAWHYCYFGLRVASALEIPEWATLACEAAAAQPDVEILVDPDLPPTGLQSHYPLAEADGVSFTVAEVATYAVRGGREIVVNPFPQAGGGVRLYLLGTAWSLLCYQRGLLILHASVTAVNGRAYAFCGPSGSGKSTLAAALLRAGHVLVADDLVRCDQEAFDQAIVYPAAPRLKLWQSALDHLQWTAVTKTSDHFRTDKYHVLLPGGAPQQTFPLDAIYLLGWGPPRLQRLTGLQALQQLVAQATYRGTYIKAMGLTPAYWRQCQRLLQRTPLYRFTRLQNLAQLPGSLALLQHHWRI